MVKENIGTVSSISIIAMIITLFISFAIPIAVFILLRRKSKNITGAFAAGAVGFYISQGLIRLPLLQALLPKFKWYSDFGSNHRILYFILLAVTAALFEETARYLVFKLLLKEKLSYYTGIAYGAGHGGMEAILIVGLTYINNLVFSFLINSGNLDNLLGGKLGGELLENIRNSLTGAPAGLFLAAGVERAFTVAFHIALSLVVLRGIMTSRSFKYYSIAVALHTLVNFTAVYLSFLKFHFWFVELFIGLVAVLSILYVRSLRKDFGEALDREDEAVQAVREGY